MCWSSDAVSIACAAAATAAEVAVVSVKAAELLQKKPAGRGFWPKSM